MAERFYITTPLYYLNAAPHIGHTYTTVAADVISRFRRARGHDVHFLTGTDEHGTKVYDKAVEAGITPQQHVDKLADEFKALWTRLDIQYDDFIRTTEPRHKEVVVNILNELFERGDIYKDSYSGWYSKAAERYWTEKDLIDGKCPDTGQEVTWLEESNYFFKMSKYADQLRAWAEARPEWVRPTSRYNEMMAILNKDVADLCITRPKERLPWGIPIPFDSDFVTYVWFDALINYISAIGYGVDNATFDARWPANYQLLGKDILATHTLYWGTMLLALGLDPADCLYAHGWWTVEGQKMSKSVGNVVDPNLLVDAYGPDAVRYVLMAEKSFGGDGDFSHKSFLLRYNAELANDIGNLAHRALSMTEKWLGGVVPELGPDSDNDIDLQAKADQAVQDYSAAVDSLDYQGALHALVALATAGNKYIDTEQPWALNKAGNLARLAGVKRRCLEICRVVGVLLQPFCPAKGTELLGRLGVVSAPFDAAVAQLDHLVPGVQLTVGEPLFPRMTELPPAIKEALDAVEGGDLKSLKPANKKKKKKGKGPKPPITFDDFQKVELKAGTVIAAVPHPNADRLLVVTVDVGEERPRSIVAGIASRYTPEDIVGTGVVVVTNLAPAELRGVLSEGMLLAAGAKSVLAMVTTTEIVDPGTIVR